MTIATMINGNGTILAVENINNNRDTIWFVATPTFISTGRERIEFTVGEVAAKATGVPLRPKAESQTLMFRRLDQYQLCPCTRQPPEIFVFMWKNESLRIKDPTPAARCHTSAN